MIYTFYSFKGGVGRSMALANIAELLYRQGENVLIIDFDLEAPGLEDYFDVKNAVFSPREIKGKRGIIDLLLSYKELRSFDSNRLFQKIEVETESKAENNFNYPVEPLANFIVPIYEHSDKGSLSIIPAGIRNNEKFNYAEKLRSFDWEDFYRNWDGELFFEWFRKETIENASFVLIDSRTGFSEMSGVCAYQLADTVVLFVSSNKQNLDGTETMAESLSNPKLVEEGRKGRQLSLIFVPSRVEQNEAELQDIFSEKFDEKFSRFYPSSLVFEKTPFIDLKIPYVPYYSFMEKVAIREGGASATDLIEAYEQLAETLLYQGNEAKLAEKLFDKAKKIWEERRDTRCIELTDKAIKIWNEHLKGNSDLYSLKLAQANKFLSDVFEKDDEPRSIAEAKKALKIYFDFYGKDPNKISQEIIPALTKLSNRLHDKEDNEAVTALIETINIQKITLQPEDSVSKTNLAKNLYDLANWLIEQEQFVNALQVNQEAVTLYRELGSKNQKRFEADLANSLITLSECLLETNNTQNSTISAIEAVKIFSSLYKDSPNLYESETAKSYNALLDILSRNKVNRKNGSLNQVQEAEQFFRETLKTNSERYKPDLAKTINLLTEPLKNEGKLDEAIGKQKEAIEIFREIKSAHSAQYESDLASSLVNLSNFLIDKNDIQSALGAAQEALQIYHKLIKQSSIRYQDDVKETKNLIDKLHKLNP